MNGFIFRSTTSTFQECMDRNLFGEMEEYLPFVERITEGIPLFLYNTTDWQIYGVFEATSKGDKYLDFQAWHGKFPAQVRIKPRDKIKSISIEKIKQIVKFKGIYPYPVLDQKQVEALINLFEYAYQ